MCMVIVSLNLAALNYYVSSSTGNDGNNGTSQSTPWRTLSKVNAALLNPGDIVNLMKGDTFSGTIIINRSGSVGNPITYSSYGSGATPIITGFASVTSWVSVGGSVWESTNAVSTLLDCNMVTIGGTDTHMGRFPNTGWMTVNSHVNQTSLTSSGINSAITNWGGAEVVAKVTNFSMVRDRITNHAGATLTTVATTPEPFGNNYGFFIENDVRTLDAQNEWYYNPTTKKIRIFSAASPTNVQVSTLDTLFYCINKSNIVVDGINFTGSNRRAFYVGSSSRIVTKNCNITFSGIYAYWGANNFGTASSFDSIYNCNISNAHSQGIVCGSEFNNVYIGHNSLIDIGQLYGMFKIPVFNNGINSVWTGAFAGIYMNLSRGDAGMTVLEYNTIQNCGYAGYWWTGSHYRIHNNEATNCVNRLMDNGGFYCIGRIDTTSSLVYQDVQVYSNLSHDNLGDSSGTPVVVGNKLANGIYFDANTVNTQCYNNSCWNNSLYGIFSNSNMKCSFTNNTLFNNNEGQMYFASTFRERRVIYNGTVGQEMEYLDSAKNNILFALSGTTFHNQVSVKFGNKYSKLDSFFLYLDSNCYTRPIDESQHVFLQLNVCCGAVFSHFNLAQWKTYSNTNFGFTVGKDANAYKSPVTITNVNQVNFQYNNTVAPVVKALPAGTWIDVKGVTYNTGSTTLQPYTSIILINTGTNLAPIANAGTNKNITLPTTSVTQVGNGSDPDGSITSYSWSQFSGPATVTFGTGTSPTTIVNGMTAPGVYVVQLRVTDNFGLTGTDTASIIVNATPPTNIPPTANAGGNKIITLPTSTVTQVGSGTDPDGSVVSYFWTKISGPATYNIVSPNSSTTVINGLTAPGVYGFQLMVTDNLGLTGTATCTITVNTPFPTPPSANAGSDQTITYPTNSVTLTGSGTDADGTIVAYNWVKVAGGVATITNANSASTTVTGLFVGVYQFQLTVTDNSGATGKDTVQITVNQGASSISFSGPTLTTFWTGLPQQPTVITTPAGLSYSITFNNVGNIPVDTGTYIVRVATNDPGFTSAFAQANFRINPAPASLSIGNSIQQYDSLLKNVTVTTNPAGLAYIITGAPQRYTGTYNITVTLNDPNHTATPVNTTLTITPGQTTVTWNPANLTYPTPTGAGQTNATSPKLGVYTYLPPSGTVLNASPSVPLQLNFVPNDTNIAPLLGITRNITVSKGTTSMTISDTIQDADGTVKSITAIPGQSGTVTVNYTGGRIVPGDYPFTASYSSANWTAPNVSGTLHILSNPANIFISNYQDRVYNDGLPISVTVTSLYPYIVAYDGSTTPPANVNPSIEVIAHITDGIHIGADTVTMNIIKANPPYTWPAIAPINTPTPLSATQLNITSSIPISVIYNPASGTVLAPGNHVLSAQITPTDAANYNVITVTNTIVVSSGTAVINVTNTSQTYNTLPHSITATTIPANLDSLDITYNGSHTLPIDAGNYTYLVRLINGTYTAPDVTGTLTIARGTYSLTWTPPMPIQLGSAITAAINNATSTIAGSFTYNYPAGSIMSIPGTIALVATFHPTDTVNYNTQSITVPLSVFGNTFDLFFISHGNTNYLNLPGQNAPFPLVP